MNVEHSETNPNSDNENAFPTSELSEPNHFGTITANASSDEVDASSFVATDKEFCLSLDYFVPAFKTRFKTINSQQDAEALISSVQQEKENLSRERGWTLVSTCINSVNNSYTRRLYKTFNGNYLCFDDDDENRLRLSLDVLITLHKMRDYLC